MTDAANDASERTAKKDLPIGEKIRLAKRGYYDALCDFMYFPTRSISRRRAAQAVVRRHARTWDELVTGNRAKSVKELLKKLTRKDEFTWSGLLCEVADMPNIFDELAGISPFAKRGGLSVVTVNGDLVTLTQGVLKDKIQEQLPRTISVMSRHLFVINHSTFFTRVGP